MKMKDMVKEVTIELEKEKENEVKAIIKERLKEIHAMQKILAKAEKQFKELLTKEIDDVVSL